MKIIVERDALAEALKIASHPIETRPTIPILANVKLTAENNRLSICGTDLEVTAVATAPCEISDAAPAITVAGRVMTTTVAGLPSGATVSLEWDAGGRDVTMKAGRSRYRFNALPASDFPLLIEPAGAVSFFLPAKELVAAFDTTQFAIAREISRTYLLGVCIRIASPGGHGGLGGHTDRRLIFVATNSRELGYRAMPVPAGTDDIPEVIIPERAVTEMTRLASGASEQVELSISPTRVTLRCGESLLSTKVIEAKFPDFMRVIPTDGYREMIADVGELDAALSRLMNVGEPTKTVLTAANGQLKFELEGDGSAEEIIEVDWPHDEIKKRVNARSILSVLQRLKTDTCVIRFHDPAKPMLFNEYAASKMVTERTFLSMPMEGS